MKRRKTAAYRLMGWLLSAALMFQCVLPAAAKSDVYITQDESTVPEVDITQSSTDADTEVDITQLSSQAGNLIDITQSPGSDENAAASATQFPEAAEEVYITSDSPAHGEEDAVSVNPDPEDAAAADDPEDAAAADFPEEAPADTDASEEGGEDSPETASVSEEPAFAYKGYSAPTWEDAGSSLKLYKYADSNSLEMPGEEFENNTIDLSEKFYFSVTLSDFPGVNSFAELNPMLVPMAEGETEQDTPSGEVLKWMRSYVQGAEVNSQEYAKYPDGMLFFYNAYPAPGGGNPRTFWYRKSYTEQDGISLCQELGLLNDWISGSGKSGQYYAEPGRYRLVYLTRDSASKQTHLNYSAPITVTDKNNLRKTEKQGTVLASFYDTKTGTKYSAKAENCLDGNGKKRDSLVTIISSEAPFYLTLSDFKLGSENEAGPVNGETIKEIQLAVEDEVYDGAMDYAMVLWRDGYIRKMISSSAGTYSLVDEAKALKKSGNMYTLDDFRVYISSNVMSHSDFFRDGYSYRVLVYTDKNTYVDNRVIRFIDNSNPTIKTKTLPPLRPGVPYEAQLLATPVLGGALSFEEVGRGWTTTSKGGVETVTSWKDELPPGITLDKKTGKITGTFLPKNGPETSSGSPENDSYKASREELMNQKWYWPNFQVTEAGGGFNTVEITLTIDWSSRFSISGLQEGEKARLYYLGPNETPPQYVPGNDLGVFPNGEHYLRTIKSYIPDGIKKGGTLFLTRQTAIGEVKDEASVCTAEEDDQLEFSLHANEVVKLSVEADVPESGIYLEIKQADGTTRWMEKQEGAYRFLKNQTIPMPSELLAGGYISDSEAWMKYLLEKEKPFHVETVDAAQGKIIVKAEPRPGDLTLKGKVTCSSTEEFANDGDGKRYPVPGAIITVTQTLPYYAGYTHTKVGVTNEKGEFTVSGLYGGNVRTTYRAYSPDYEEQGEKPISGDLAYFGTTDRDEANSPYFLGDYQGVSHYIVLLPGLGMQTKSFVYGYDESGNQTDEAVSEFTARAADFLSPSFSAALSNGKEQFFEGTNIGSVVWADEQTRDAITAYDPENEEQKGRTVYEAYFLPGVPRAGTGRLTRIKIMGLPGDQGEGIEAVRQEGTAVFIAKEMPGYALLDYTEIRQGANAKLTVADQEGAEVPVYGKNGNTALIKASAADEEYTVILSPESFALPHTTANRIQLSGIQDGTDALVRTVEASPGEVCALTGGTVPMPDAKGRTYALMNLPATALSGQEYELSGMIYPGNDGFSAFEVIAPRGYILQAILNGQTLTRDAAGSVGLWHSYTLPSRLYTPAFLRIKLKMPAADVAASVGVTINDRTPERVSGRQIFAGRTKCAWSLTLNVPKKVAADQEGKAVVRFHGTGMGGKNIYLYDNGTPVSITGTNGSGGYSGQFTLLGTERFHEITASYIAPDMRGIEAGAYAKATALLERTSGEAVLTGITMEVRDVGPIHLKPGQETFSYSVPSRMTARYSAEIAGVYGTEEKPLGLERFSYAADEETQKLQELLAEYEAEEDASEKASLKKQIVELNASLETTAWAFFNVATAGGLYTIPAVSISLDEKTHVATVTSDWVSQGDDFTTGITVEYQASDPDALWEQVEYTDDTGQTHTQPVIEVEDRRKDAHPVMEQDFRKMTIADMLPDDQGNAELTSLVNNLQTGKINEAQFADALDELMEENGALKAEMEAAEQNGLSDAALIDNGYWDETDMIPKPSAPLRASLPGFSGEALLRDAARFSQTYTDAAGNTYTLPEAIALRNKQIMENIEGMKSMFKNYSGTYPNPEDPDGEPIVIDDPNPFGKIDQGADFEIKAFGLVTEKNANINDPQEKDEGGGMTVTFYQDFASAVDELMMPKYGYEKSVYRYEGYTTDQDGNKVSEDEPLDLPMYSATTYYKKDGSLITVEEEKYDGTAAAQLDTYIYKNPEVPAGNPFRWSRIQYAIVAPGTPSPICKSGFVAILNMWRPFTYKDKDGNIVDNPARQSTNLHQVSPLADSGSSFKTAAGQAENGAGWSFQIIPKKWDDYSDGTKWGLVSFGLASATAAGTCAMRAANADQLAKLSKASLISDADKMKKINDGIKVVTAQGETVIQGEKAVKAAIEGQKLVYVTHEGEVILTNTRNYAKISGELTAGVKISTALAVTDDAIGAMDKGAYSTAVASYAAKGGPAGASIEEIDRYCKESYNESRDLLRYVSAQAVKPGTKLNEFPDEAQSLKEQLVKMMNEEAMLEEEMGYTAATSEFGSAAAKTTFWMGAGITAVSVIPAVNLFVGGGLAVAGAGVAGIGFISTAIADNKLAAARRRLERLVKQKEELREKLKAWGIPPEEEEKDKKDGNGKPGSSGGSGGSGTDGGGGGTGGGTPGTPTGGGTGDGGGGTGTGGGSGTGTGGGSGGSGGGGNGGSGGGSTTGGGGPDGTDDSPTNNRGNGTGGTPNSPGGGGRNSSGGRRSNSGKPGDVTLQGFADPSGIVYEAVLSNPVSGAQVEIHTSNAAVNAGWEPVYEGEPGGVPANAGEASGYTSVDRIENDNLNLILPQERIQETGADGRYQWDVAQGLWFVTASAPGYEQTGNSNADVNATVSAGETNWLPVLPAQLDVNIPLVDDAAPKIKEVLIKEDKVLITFDKYMKVESLGIPEAQEITRQAENEDGTAAEVTTREWQLENKDSVLDKYYSLTDLSGKKLPYTLRYLDAEQAPANIRYAGGGEAPWYVSRIRLKLDTPLPEGDGLIIKLLPGEGQFISYAGTPMEAEEYEDANGKTEQVLYSNEAAVEKTETVETPVITPDKASIDILQQVSITCATPDALIYYTTNDSAELNTNCAVYTAPFTLPAGKTTVRAFAVKAGFLNSEEAKREYTVSGGSGSGGSGEGTADQEKKDEQEIADSGQEKKLIRVVGLSEAFPYTGSAIKPEPRVYLYEGTKRTLLTLNTDYTLSYKNNTNAAAPDGKAYDPKAPSVTVKMKGSYAGSYTGNFTIAPKSIADEDVAKNNIAALIKLKKVDGIQVPQPQKLVPVLTYNGKTLKVNKDFTIEYPEESNSRGYGSFTLKLKGIGNYAGSAEVLEILKDKTDLVNLSSVKAEMIGKVEYYDPGAPKAQTPAFRLTRKVRSDTVNLTEGRDYTVTWSGNIYPGTATVTFTAMEDSLYYGTKKMTFKIPEEKLSMSDDRIDISLVSASVPYAKAGAIPQVVVKDLRYNPAKTLTPGVDYMLSYSNNKKLSIGDAKAKVIVSGKGKYTGKELQDYSVDPQELSKMTLVIDDFVSAGAGKDKENAYRKAKITLYDPDGKPLSASADYYVSEWKTASGSEKPAPGETVYITIKPRISVSTDRAVKGSGFYTGELTGSFRVIEKSTAKLSAIPFAFKAGGASSPAYDSAKKGFVYQGSPVCPDASNLILKPKGANTTELKEGADYEILAYLNNKKAGTGKLILRGKGSYGGLKTISFKILPGQDN